MNDPYRTSAALLTMRLVHCKTASSWGAMGLLLALAAAVTATALAGPTRGSSWRFVYFGMIVVSPFVGFAVVGALGLGQKAVLELGPAGLSLQHRGAVLARPWNAMAARMGKDAVLQLELGEHVCSFLTGGGLLRTGPIGRDQTTPLTFHVERPDWQALLARLRQEGLLRRV